MDDLASEWAGIETVCLVENDPFCQKVLKKHWPNTPIIGDIKDVTRESINKIMANANVFGKVGNESEYRKGGRSDENNKGNGSRIGIVAGGFPCQPHSVAGKRQGSSDERNLWPEFRRVVEEVKPRWVLGENVPGLFTSDGGHYFGTIIADLAALGYVVTWITLSASDVGAMHKRERLFIVAYAYGDKHRYEKSRSIVEKVRTSAENRTQDDPTRDVGRTSKFGRCDRYDGTIEGEELANAAGIGTQGDGTPGKQISGTYVGKGVFGSDYPGRGKEDGFPESELGRSTYGHSDWLDGRYIVAGRGEIQHEWEPPRLVAKMKNRAKRIKAIGNANPPQLYFQIYREIVRIENEMKKGELINEYN